jgi:hypothetical protein
MRASEICDVEALYLIEGVVFALIIRVDFDTDDVLNDLSIVASLQSLCQISEVIWNHDQLREPQPDLSIRTDALDFSC